jgi:hypothetical protein
LELAKFILTAAERIPRIGGNTSMILSLAANPSPANHLLLLCFLA